MNIPNNAVSVSFDYGKSKGKFYVWEKRGGKWEWSALGNNGESNSFQAAVDSARCWIKESYVQH